MNRLILTAQLILLSVYCSARLEATGSATATGGFSRNDHILSIDAQYDLLSTAQLLEYGLANSLRLTSDSSEISNQLSTLLHTKSNDHQLKLSISHGTRFQYYSAEELNSESALLSIDIGLVGAAEVINQWLHYRNFTLSTENTLASQLIKLNTPIATENTLVFSYQFSALTDLSLFAKNICSFAIESSVLGCDQEFSSRINYHKRRTTLMFESGLGRYNTGWQQLAKGSVDYQLNSKQTLQGSISRQFYDWRQAFHSPLNQKSITEKELIDTFISSHNYRGAQITANHMVEYVPAYIAIVPEQQNDANDIEKIEDSLVISQRIALALKFGWCRQCAVSNQFSWQHLNEQSLTWQTGFTSIWSKYYHLNLNSEYQYMPTSADDYSASISISYQPQRIRF